MTSPDPATPPIPPVPAYGEYASPEHAEAARQSQVPPAAQPAPTAQQPYGQPQYGQPQYQQQPYGQQPYQAIGQPQTWNGQRPLRTGDMIASIILLVVGFFSTIYAVLNAVSLNFQFEALYEENGVSSSYEPGVGTTVATIVIIASHLILLAIAATVTITLIRKRKVSFWVPLVAGALASIIFLVAVVVVIVADPNLMDAITQQTL